MVRKVEKTEGFWIFKRVVVKEYATHKEILEGKQWNFYKRKRTDEVLF